MINDNLKELCQLLSKANAEDRANLRAIINAPYGDNPEHLCDHISYLGLTGGFLMQHYNKRNYKQIVTDVADEIKIDWVSFLGTRTWHELSEAEIENVIVVTLLQRLPEETRRGISKSIGDVTNDRSVTDKLLLLDLVDRSHFEVGYYLGKLTELQLYLLSSTALIVLSQEFKGKIKSLPITLPLLTIYPTIPILEYLWSAWSQPQKKELTHGIIYISTMRHRIVSGLEINLQLNDFIHSHHANKLIYLSDESLNPIRNIVNEASQAINDKTRTTSDNADINELLALVGGTGVGAGIGFAGLYFLGTVGLSAVGITTGLATAGTLVGGGMAAGIGVLAAPAIILGAAAYYIVSQINKKKLKETKEMLLQEVLRKHNGIIEELKRTAAKDGKRISYLTNLIELLKRAIQDLGNDLGDTAS